MLTTQEGPIEGRVEESAETQSLQGRGPHNGSTVGVEPATSIARHLIYEDGEGAPRPSLGEASSTRRPNLEEQHRGWARGPRRQGRESSCMDCAALACSSNCRARAPPRALCTLLLPLALSANCSPVWRPRLSLRFNSGSTLLLSPAAVFSFLARWSTSPFLVSVPGLDCVRAPSGCVFRL